MRAASTRTLLEEERRRSRDRLRNWCIWKVLLPLGLLALLWPVNAIILGLPHAFESAFAHGELLIFSVLILLEAAVEGEHLRRQSQWFQAALGVTKVSAFFVLFIFGFIKADMLRNGEELNGLSALPTLQRTRLADPGALDASTAQVTQVTTGHQDGGGLDGSAGRALEKMRLYSSFNMLVAIVAIIGSLTTYLTIVAREYEERKAEIAEERSK
jgi:hypothetical protein